MHDLKRLKVEKIKLKHISNKSYKGFVSREFIPLFMYINEINPRFLPNSG